MTYRVELGTTIVREDPDGRIAVVALVALGDQALAEQICTLLNATPEFGRWCEQETGEKCCGLEALEEPTRETPTGPAHTPDVDHIRGAAEALAEVRRRIDRWSKLADDGERLDSALAYGILRAAAAELGVSEDAPSGPAVAPQTAEQPAMVGPDRADDLSGSERRSWGDPAHPTCLDVTLFSRPRETAWMCGPDCPREPERKANR